MRRSITILQGNKHKHFFVSLAELTVNDFFGGFDGVFILGDDGRSGRNRRSCTVWSKTVVADYRSSALKTADTGAAAVLHRGRFDYG